MLLDFGEAFDISLVENEANAANHIGNLVFLPPEVLMKSDLVTGSFRDLASINFPAEALEKC